MKKFKEIIRSVLKDFEIKKIIGNVNIDISSLHFDSRKVEKRSVFIAINGLANNGHDYIDKAIEAGAIAIVCQKIPENIQEGITYIQLENTEKVLGQMSTIFYGNPSRKIRLVGITGTNGKTTTVTLLYRLFKDLGYKVGLISTIENRIDDETVKANYTTPHALELNKLLCKMVEKGCQYCFMEVSSHAIVQERIAGIHFAGAIFTNITHEHLDYHKTFNEYIYAKKQFFDNLSGEAFALVNADDKNSKVMVQNTKANKYTYALKTNANFKTQIIEKHFDGTLLNIDGIEVWTQLPGVFNAYNALAVYATAILLGESKNQIATVISGMKSVAGRFETITSPNGIVAVVDYAHTPDALLNVLKTIAGIKKKDQNLLTIVGAGGDRDKEKRPIMAKYANEFSERVILTSDNPRTENPESIIEDMQKGINEENQKNVLCIVDRHEAIKTACLLAKPHDIILIAGKGHETYQEINSERFPFDDRKIVAEIFEMLYK